MDFQVRKGLETPLKVHGMRTKFFCIYCIILAVIVLFVVGFLTSAMSGEGSFLAFIVSLVAGAFAASKGGYGYRRVKAMLRTRVSEKVLRSPMP